MVMVDDNGRMVLVNREMERLFGYQREELIGAPVDKLIPERLRSRDPKTRDAFFRAQVPRHLGIGREFYGILFETGRPNVGQRPRRLKPDRPWFCG